jgi:ABC transport system ATP-binding/permease protein
LSPKGPAPKDSFWEHTPKVWIFNMGIFAVLCIGYATFVRWKIRLKVE